MSGIEIIGLAASVIQIAELGGKLSVQLFTFTRKVNNANKSIDILSQDIAATGAVLKQVGEAFSKDDQLRTCSSSAISTARGLVEDTKKVFESLKKIIEGDEKANNNFAMGISLKQRLKFPFLESKIEEVRANLERLKSSLLVILNVLIFAEQMRNHEALPILKDQRDLIRVLSAEKDEDEKRYQKILMAIEDNSSGHVSDTVTINKGFNTSLTSVDTGATLTINDQISEFTSTNSNTNRGQQALPFIDLDLPRGLKHQQERIAHHAYLVQNLVTEISSPQYKIDYGTRDRMHNGVLNIHFQEWVGQRSRWGIDVLERIFATNADVIRFWEDAFYKVEPESDNIVIENQPNLQRSHYLQPTVTRPSRRRARATRTAHYGSDLEGSDSNYEEIVAPSRQHRLYSRRRRTSSSIRQESPEAAGIIAPEVAKRLAKLELYEKQSKNEMIDPEIAAKLEKLKILEEERSKHTTTPPQTAANLVRLGNHENTNRSNIPKDNERSEDELIETMRLREREERKRQQAKMLEHEKMQKQLSSDEAEVISRANRNLLPGDTEGIVDGDVDVISGETPFDKLEDNEETDNAPQPGLAESLSKAKQPVRHSATPSPNTCEDRNPQIEDDTSGDEELLAHQNSKAASRPSPFPQPDHVTTTTCAIPNHGDDMFLVRKKDKKADGVLDDVDKLILEYTNIAADDLMKSMGYSEKSQRRAWMFT